MQQYSVSVVIPTLNRDDFLMDAIHDMLQQDYLDYDIIVVDQSNNTPEKIRKLVTLNPEKIKYYNVRFRGLPEARNFGWQHSNKDIILYIDDDIRANPQLISEHIKSYTDDAIALVGGGIDEPNRQPKQSNAKVGGFNYWTCTPSRGFESKISQYVLHVPGGNFSVRRRVLEAVGGIDENLSLGAALYEETDLSLRVLKAGFKAFFNANARLTHLVAAEGGCRVTDIPRYMWGLAHNRSILIGRHLKKVHKVTAFARLLLLSLSYSRTASSFAPFLATVKGIYAGVQASKQIVKITSHVIH